MGLLIYSYMLPLLVTHNTPPSCFLRPVSTDQIRQISSFEVSHGCLTFGLEELVEEGSRHDNLLT